MKRKALFCCISFCLVLASVSAIRTLNSTEDLNKTNFGKTFPRHGLKLLYWLANNVTIDQNGIVSWRGQYNVSDSYYVFHHYHNHEGTPFPVLDDNSGRAYYSVGNLNLPEQRNQLPPYVTQDYENTRTEQTNLNNVDRILITIQTNNPSVIEEVYITQHYEDSNRGSEYDPDNTYQISPQLLQQIQDLHSGGTTSHLQMVYSPNPGLIRFLEQAGYDSSGALDDYMNRCQCTDPYIGSLIKHVRRPRHSPDTKPKCEKYNKIKVKVKTTENGHAKITWSGLPVNLLRMKHVTHIGLYNGVREDPLEVYPLNGRTDGSIDTTKPLKPGLQVKVLHSETYTSYIFFTSVKHTVIWSGPQSDEANGVLPKNIAFYDARLQLYIKDGHACARLYIKKSFTYWKDVFYNSWVGFYKSPHDNNDNYNTYQWSIEFVKGSVQHYCEGYNIYEYESDMTIRPGVHLRFMLYNSYDSEIVRTASWN